MEVSSDFTRMKDFGQSEAWDCHVKAPRSDSREERKRWRNFGLTFMKLGMISMKFGMIQQSTKFGMIFMKSRTTFMEFGIISVKVGIFYAKRFQDLQSATSHFPVLVSLSKGIRCLHREFVKRTPGSPRIPSSISFNPTCWNSANTRPAFDSL